VGAWLQFARELYCELRLSDMRNFILGIVITILVLLIGSLGLALLGWLPTRADIAPPEMERHFAMSALDNSVDRHAPRLNSPVPPTDENLIEGLKIYTMNCALCHGGIDRQPSPLEKSFYPPPPNLILHPLDDEEWHVFYVIRTGVRYTGMPAWDKTLSEPDMWKLTAFLTRVEKLPPAVQDYWKKSSGVSPPTGEQEAHHDHK
jgi:mono/diheme cytochrome c family protein